MKKLLLIIAALLAAVTSFAQSGGVKGTIVNRMGKVPVEGALVRLYNGSVLLAEVRTDAEGNFNVPRLDNGMYDMTIDAEDFLQTRVNVTVNDGYVKNMFTLSLTPQQNVADLDDDSFADFDLEDSGYSDSPVILYGNDIFNNIAGYRFSAIRFKTRGYANEAQEVYLAGVKMNDAATGYGPYSLWTGLNEATRTKESLNGLEISDFGLGGYNGMVNIPGNASNVRKGWRGSVMTNSTSYRLRLMMTYASGELDNGWSYAFSASARLGGNDWVKGVYYRSFAYYAAFDKKFDGGHKLGFTVLGTPGQRGAQNASTQEVYDLMKDNMYNSNWGYQNGKVRNARVRKTHEPIMFLNYDFNPSYKLNVSATFLYRFGKNGYTALDWYDAPDPRPDYYRNLPSYFYNSNPDYDRNDATKAAWAEEMWRYDMPQYTHINWDHLYEVNKTDFTESGNRSKYVQEERRVDQQDLNFVANAKWTPVDFFTLAGGINLKWNRTENYKIMADLLGGDYYINIDQFAERDYAFSNTMIQNDLDYYIKNGEAQKIKKGDKYGYDYYSHVRTAGLWASGRFSWGGLNADISGKIGYTGFWRQGLVRKGLFPGLDSEGKPFEYQGVDIASGVTDPDGGITTSYGNSKKMNFLTYGAKLNIGYNFDGGHRVWANAGYFSDAPTFSGTFISPRTRNTVMPDIKNIKTVSTDINYLYLNSGYEIRVTGYWTKIMDQSDVMSFYDDSRSSFTNLSLTGIDQRHMGVELGFKIPIPVQGLSLQGAVSWGEYIYTSNPVMYQTYDNSNEIIDETYGVQIPYWKSHPIFKRDTDGNYLLDEDFQPTFEADRMQKHYVPSTPQLATSLGLAWSYNYWNVEVNAQYFTNSYLSMNPLYRSDMATTGADGAITPAEIEYMAAQEKFDPVVFLNASVGKSWYIKRKYQIGFSLNVNNALNNRNAKTGGYEQTRLVDNTKDNMRYYRFDPKYFYTSGVNYMLNIYFKF